MCGGSQGRIPEHPPLIFCAHLALTKSRTMGRLKGSRSHGFFARALGARNSGDVRRACDEDTICLHSNRIFITFPPTSQKHTSELQSHSNLLCHRMLEKKTITS